jgi:hypothetical protein
METRIVDGVEVRRGSGNVFADLGLPDAVMDCLTRLGHDIEIKVRPAKAELGHLMFAVA